jgi:hypothetical protein
LVAALLAEEALTLVETAEGREFTGSENSLYGARNVLVFVAGDCGVGTLDWSGSTISVPVAVGVCVESFLLGASGLGLRVSCEGCYN